MSEGPFPRITPTLRSAIDPFTDNTVPLGYTLLDFWQWSASDLLSNAQRGILAEFIIARAIGIELTQPRQEWDAYDLVTKDGTRIEVKSSSYLQTWHHEKLSKVSFSIRKAKFWDPSTGKVSPEPTHAADIYVFALLAHKDKCSVDPMQIEQWRFYVVPTKELEKRKRSQHSITLPSLQKIAPELRYSDLRAEIERGSSELVN
ncbi:MAG: hypothetical protein FJY92_06015 [Candidatus Hydrogenedentes bacterium]|nr:hypothetical protein [Candidatus Hydrogenedentota bacterium]